MSFSDHDIKSTAKLSLNTQNSKGKYASSTEHRRFVWEYVVWPLVLDKNSNCFTPKEYLRKRNKVCKDNNISPFEVAGGVVSLLNKGILFNDQKGSVHLICFISLL
ncbi:MAG TPA: hypothetical protein VFG45_02735 [Candidatus Nitrosocosmicus sp.]|nr:hypothetical protein [Candidatus Nitrosocosmicus sp.]